MYIQLNSVIVDGDAANRHGARQLPHTFGVHLVGQFQAADQLTQVLSRPDAPQLVIINLDPARSDNLKKIGKLPRQFPNISFFVMSQVLDPNLLMEAMHLGVKEFIPLPIAEQKFAAAIERVAAAARHGQAGPDHSRDPDDRRVRLDHRRVQRRRFARRQRRKTCADRSGPDPRRRRQLFRHPPALHDRRRDGIRREARQAIARQRAGDPPQNSGLAILARPELPEDTQRVNQAGVHAAAQHPRRMFDYVGDRFGDEHRSDLCRQRSRRRT